jgi:HEPN domain-containing protein
MTAKSKGTTRGTLFKHIAAMRLEDARVLLARNRHHGALYLAGYSVECALKWAITRRLAVDYLPAHLEIHDLDRLMGESGLAEGMKTDTAIAPLFSALVDEWGPHGRYAAPAMDGTKAKRLYNQIKQVYEWLIEQSL